MKKLMLLALFTIVTSAHVFAQNSNRAVEQFKNNTNALVTVNDNTGVPEFIRFTTNNKLQIKGRLIEDKAIQFLETYKELYDIDDLDSSFLSENAKTDNYGLKHITLKQLHQGVPVYDGQLKFHFDTEEKLSAINGNFIPNIKLNATPSLSQSEANSIAVSTVNSQGINNSGESLFVNKSTLYIFQKGLAQGHFQGVHLVYEVEVRNDLDVREFIFVDGHSGQIIEQFTGMAHALDRIVYEGNTNNIVWQEGDTPPSDASSTLTIWQKNEVEASAHMYNFFNNAFSYESYDGAGITMRTINNNPNIACPNANWNGSTANYCNGTATDDVIAHEWGHAYTEYTSNLIYAFQSGAINESYSDIWGETIDLLNGYEDADDDQSLRTGCGSSDRWRVGEDASAFGGAIRDMWNPPCQGDPGKVTDGQYFCGNGDSGGVHINSGIPNHAYALLVDGGTFNGQTIQGIGFTKAAHVFWRAQSTYLTATSDFSNLADALEMSANDLVGVNLEGLSTTATAAGPSGETMTINDVNQVIAAILAVELRINPDVCGFTPILGPTADLCLASTNNPIFYEDWESGIGNWTVLQLPTNAATWEPRDWTIESNLPDGRVGSAIFGIDPINGNCTSDLENGIIRLQSPVINIPNYQNGTFDLAFNHNISTEPNWDGGNIKYNINGSFLWTVVPSSAFVENGYNGAINAGTNDNPMLGQEAFTGSDEGSSSGSWGKSVINLSSLGILPNSTVQFRFEMGTDGCNGRVGWYIDEVTLYNCTELLSVTEFDNLDSILTVYPNPSNGLFTLRKSNRIDLKLATIYDINGRVIKTIDLTNVQVEHTFDLSEVSSGLYFMRVNSIDSSTTIKLIKN